MKKVISISVVLVVLFTMIVGTNVFAHEHVWPSTWTVTVSPTCTINGTEVKRCMECDALLASQSIPATGHSWPSSWSLVTSPTCTTSGTEEKRCTTCSMILDINIVSATGHTLGSWYYDHCYWDDINLIWVDVFRRECTSCSYYEMSE